MCQLRQVVRWVCERRPRFSGLRLGFSLPKIPPGFHLGGESQTAHVAMDVRLIDASTGQLLQSNRVERKSNAAGFSAEQIRRMDRTRDSIIKQTIIPFLAA